LPLRAITVDDTDAGKDAAGHDGADELAPGDAVLDGHAEDGGFTDRDVAHVLPDAPCKGNLN